jgi:hypothetical protein
MRLDFSPVPRKDFVAVWRSTLQSDVSGDAPVAPESELPLRNDLHAWRTTMATPKHSSDLVAPGLVDDLDEVLRRANPNPTRQDCPSHDVLVGLSRRARPIGDPAYEHLLECSPCYAEVRDMQRSHVLGTSSIRGDD